MNKELDKQFTKEMLEKTTNEAESKFTLLQKGAVCDISLRQRGSSDYCEYNVRILNITGGTIEVGLTRAKNTVSSNQELTLKDLHPDDRARLTEKDRAQKKVEYIKTNFLKPRESAESALISDFSAKTYRESGYLQIKNASDWASFPDCITGVVADLKSCITRIPTIEAEIASINEKLEATEAQVAELLRQSPMLTKLKAETISYKTCESIQANVFESKNNYTYSYLLKLEDGSLAVIVSDSWLSSSRYYLKTLNTLRYGTKEFVINGVKRSYPVFVKMADMLNQWNEFRAVQAKQKKLQEDIEKRSSELMRIFDKFKKYGIKWDDR